MKKNYIPTINISALLNGNFKNKKEMKILKEIEKASINVGFFQIVGHGIRTHDHLDTNRPLVNLVTP